VTTDPVTTDPVTTDPVTTDPVMTIPVVVSDTVPEKPVPVSEEKEENFEITKVEEIKDAAQPADKTPESILSVDFQPEIDTKSIWSSVLDNIISAGQMTIYLFLLPAKPAFETNALKILFEEKDRLNYNELTKKQNYQIISQAVFQATGLSYTISLGLESEETKKSDKDQDMSGSGLHTEATGTGNSPAAEPSESDPFGALKNSAKELGISFYMEE
jgi:hypothetical protein